MESVFCTWAERVPIRIRQIGSPARAVPKQEDLTHIHQIDSQAPLVPIQEDPTRIRQISSTAPAVPVKEHLFDSDPSDY